MFSNLPAAAHVGGARSYSWLIGLTAAAYFVVWLALITLVPSPWQPHWMLLGIFGPLIMLAVVAPLWFALANAREQGRRPELASRPDPASRA